MKIKHKKLFIATMISIAISLLYTILIAFVDKKAIGPEESSVGFAQFNEFFKNIIGQNETFYKATKYSGIIILLLAVVYCVITLIQAIKRKSIKKIDKELLILCIFYIGIALLYVLFELIKINYRPVLIDGKLEPSYPSTHTLISVFICTTAIITNAKLITHKGFRVTLNTLTIAIGIFTIIGRMLSGVHWMTDIIGAILISISMILAYITITKSICEKPITINNQQSEEIKE